MSWHSGFRTWAGLAASATALLVFSASHAQAQGAADPVPAEQQPAAQGTDEQAIRDAAEAYVKAFNAGDASAVAAAWADDGEWTDEYGRNFKGRDDIEREFAAIFAEQPGAEIDIDIASIRFLSPDVAVETGTSHARSKKGSAGAPIKYTAVHVKRDGKWQLANVNESRVADAGGEQRLAGLAFLVGEWKADLGQGKTYRLNCEWMPEKAFLKRTFTVDEGKQTLSSGTQIIGWDPVLGSVVSWTFDSSGGFGHEMWQDKGERWEISASSVMPDGATALSTNYLKRLNNNAFTWQSVERSMNEQLLPDTALVRVERVSQ
ncbi:MAG: SgcJ/EcaC family oxidoreductase [Planctomycetota bacterium]|nr:MAG: SgcJ/EcaC family oxidoreductase [Planctomycetota bacterium]